VAVAAGLREAGMNAEPVNAVTLFYCYAYEDEPLRDELEKHLAALKRSGYIC
jgi:hypothetical protein